MEAEAVYQAMLDARNLLDASNSEKQGSSSLERCIAFRVADEYYAVELASVKEVIEPPAIVPVPGAPSEVLGVINLRGSVLTVVNSRAALGLGGVPDGGAARILVLDEHGEYVGALVDAVEDIVTIDGEQLNPVPAAGGGVCSAHVRGTMTIGERIAFVMRGSGFTEPAAQAP